ncbi:transcriptional regulator [Streptomyces sp. NPDC005483]|uniref:tetratricopeptide repeat protein n=1 Tax=Streptomyces sp. NPDC005483 TaxID=3154882 RepID=UPI0033A3FBEF
MTMPRWWQSKDKHVPPNKAEHSTASATGSARRVIAKSSVAAGGDIGAYVEGNNNTVYVNDPTAEAGTAGGLAPHARLIGECDPFELEVHHAIKAVRPPDPQNSGLPAYVARPHDEVLGRVVAAAAGGQSRMLMLVGESSTGKTRSCWEAVQALIADEWVLWHPFDPTRADAALAGLESVGPKTVVWLNEAQHYLMPDTTGERISAALRSLLSAPDRAPVLVLGTLWPRYWDTITTLPAANETDAYAQARELLAGRDLRVPDAFTSDELKAAKTAARGDSRLALALDHADSGRIAQFLAGAEELAKRYEHAPTAARAVLDVAVDARRLRAIVNLPIGFLEQAAAGYLTDEQFHALDDDWFEQALSYTARPVHGGTAPLRRIRSRPGQPSPANGPVYRLADYLEQHGHQVRQDICPPESFWEASLVHIDDLQSIRALERSARTRWRLRHARLLRIAADQRDPDRQLLADQATLHAAGQAQQAEALGAEAAARGHGPALRRLCLAHEEAGRAAEAEKLALETAHDHRHLIAELVKIRTEAGRFQDAERLALKAVEHGAPGGLPALASSLSKVGQDQDAERFALEAAKHGSPYVLATLAEKHAKAGHFTEAEDLALKAAEHGAPWTLVTLATSYERSGRQQEAERVVSGTKVQAQTLVALAEMRDEAGQRTDAERLAVEAADRGATKALCSLTRWRHDAGETAEAERLALKAAEYGDTEGLDYLGRVKLADGDTKAAERLAHTALKIRKSGIALGTLARLHAAEGHDDEAERLGREAARHSDAATLGVLAEKYENAGRLVEAERLAFEAARFRNPQALVALAALRKESKDHAAAERLVAEASRHGEPTALDMLAKYYLADGYPEVAKRLARLSADRGSDSKRNHSPQVWRQFWPHGLEPDGTPSQPWPGSTDHEHSHGQG